jgi:hypothetical protein
MVPLLASYSSRPVMGNLSNAMIVRTTLKIAIRLVVDLCNSM